LGTLVSYHEDSFGFLRGFFGHQAELQNGLVERGVVGWDLDIPVEDQSQITYIRNRLDISFQVLAQLRPILDNPCRQIHGLTHHDFGLLLTLE
jgi:hypothetical protein